MFIGIAGPMCAGKRTIADYLIAQHGFSRLRLRHVHTTSAGNNNRDALAAVETPGTTAPGDDHDKAVNGLSNGVKDLAVNGDGKGDVWFESMVEMTEFVTKRWREHFVTVDIWTQEDLEVVAKRPFFLLISVDAPITVRWNRFNKRSQHAFPSKAHVIDV